jgi:hypothetical protein
MFDSDNRSRRNNERSALAQSITLNRVEILAAPKTVFRSVSASYI